jgi:replication factor C subunit 2/4
MKERLSSIAQAEGCKDSVKNVLDQVLEIADGDMRRAVTTLQSIHTLSLGEGLTIDSNVIAEIVGCTPPATVENLWQACTSGTFDTMQAAVEEFCASGFSAQLLLRSLVRKLVEDPALTEACKADIAIRMAEAEKNMIDGADEYLQLMTLCSLVQTSFHKSMEQNN